MPPTAESPRAARGGSGTPLGATGPAWAICAPVLAQADGEHGDWLEYTDDYGTSTPGRAEALGAAVPPRAPTRLRVATWRRPGLLLQQGDERNIVGASTGAGPVDAGNRRRGDGVGVSRG